MCGIAVRRASTLRSGPPASLAPAGRCTWSSRCDGPRSWGSALRLVAVPLFPPPPFTQLPRPPPADSHQFVLCISESVSVSYSFLLLLILIISHQDLHIMSALKLRYFIGYVLLSFFLVGASFPVSHNSRCNRINLSTYRLYYRTLKNDRGNYVTFCISLKVQILFLGTCF